MDILEKPRLRGVFHQYAFYVAVVAGIVLVAFSDSGRELVATWIYAAALAAMFGVSALYHRVTWRSPRVRKWMRRLDHSTILLLIAGTYTPLAWILLRGRWRSVTLASVWAITAVATALLAAGGPLSQAWMTGLYLGMGWGVVACYGELARAVSHRGLALLVAGGVSYSVGAVLNATHWPTPWPGVVGPHELFHLFTLGGSACHYAFVLRVAVPFGEGTRPLPALGSRKATTPARVQAGR